MSVARDPEGHETAALLDIVDLGGKHVLEIGCGDGRLTWRYVSAAEHVTAIDPNPDDIATALEQRPPDLHERVAFLVGGIESFTLPETSPGFDVAILSWSL